MATDGGKDGIFGSLTVMAVDDAAMDLRLITMILDGLGVGTAIGVESAAQPWSAWARETWPSTWSSAIS